MVSRRCRLQLKFWGVRGSIATPNRENLGYGGNTPCVEIRGADGELLIIDGGTGIRNLGLSLAGEFKAKPLSFNVLLTHFHWDHIQGIPFFLPFYNPSSHATIYSFPPKQEIFERLQGQMTTPYFPVDFERLAGSIESFQVGSETLRFGELSVQSFPLNHPQGACGYRIESGGASIVYASDLEHGDPALDKVVREFSEGADVLIYDSQYTPEEYPSRKGWGHSTWLEATKVATDARVKHLILYHHEPSHDDAKVDSIVEETRKFFDRTSAAREGWSLEL
jgi:phosphoribosyl 1,2-cyclic phosphodiesterase